MFNNLPGQEQASHEALDAVFDALAHPIRREMLARLVRGPATVGELAEPFEVTGPAISHHVQVMETAGVVVRTRQGRSHRIALAKGPLRAVARWLDQYRVLWAGDRDL